jgi:RNA polymerase sigma factor (sigma-70 family)
VNGRDSSDARIRSLIETHYLRLLRFGVMLDRNHGEDLVQEAMIRAIARWPRDAPSEAFVSWVQTTMVRLHLNTLRRARRELAAVMRLSREIPFEVAEDRGRLLDAVASLPPRQRVAVILRYLEDLPLEAIAQRMGCRLGTVKALLHQARTRLGMTLED